jgi:hypothetical protein
MDDEVLSEAEVAKILGLQERSLRNRRCMKKPIPPFIQIPGSKYPRYLRTSVMSWLHSLESKDVHPSLEGRKRPYSKAR